MKSIHSDITPDRSLPRVKPSLPIFALLVTAFVMEIATRRLQLEFEYFRKLEPQELVALSMADQLLTQVWRGWIGAALAMFLIGLLIAFLARLCRVPGKLSLYWIAILGMAAAHCAAYVGRTR